MKNLCRITTFIFIISFSCIIKADAQNTIVKITGGYIRGEVEQQAIVFKGVPYAKPPVGTLRFLPPQPTTAWKDTLACDKFGNQAAQSGGGGLKGSEDCLSLNVYTQSANKKAKMPVLVWVHGGGMTGGSGMGTNGHAFADRDSIVTVTINYRLGVFGFMYLGDVGKAYQTAGNNGLLDLVMALKWVKQNISALGGDPSKVTVMGESAGAKLVSTLLVAPQAKGYFNQLILESGAVQCIRDSTTSKAIRQRLMTELGITKPADLLNISTEKIIAAQNKVLSGAQGTSYFGPVQDGVVINADPYRYISKNNDKRIKLLIGTNKYEARLFMGGDKRLYNPDSTSLVDWFGKNGSVVLSAIQSEAKHTTTDTAALTLLTQYMYQMHSYRLANTLSQAGSNIWMYRFNYKRDGTGATHADELQYVWLNPQNRSFNDAEISLGNQIHQAWVNFIKGKNPGEISHQAWPLYKADDNMVMVFDKVSGPTKLKSVYNDPAFPSAVLVLK